MCTLSKNSLKNILASIPIFISVIALLFSWLSYQSSLKSNEVAEKALAHSKEVLIKAERPYLNVEIEQFKKGKTFLEAEITSQGVLLSIKYEIQNRGKSIATNISNPEIILLSGAFNPKLNSENLVFKKNNRMSLGPEESQTMIFDIGLTAKDNKKLYDDLIDNKYSITLKMVWYYQDNLSKNKYKTILKTKIKKTEVEIIEKLME